MDILVLARTAERRARADVLIERSRLQTRQDEPLAERIVQLVSRFLGVAAFVAAVGTITVLLVR